MHGWFIYIACSRQVPARRPNQLAPEIVSISSEGLVSIDSTRIHCWGGSAASENHVYLMDWVQSRPQGFNCASAVHRLCVGSLVRECISQALVLVLRAPHGAFSPATTRSEPCRMAKDEHENTPTETGSVICCPLKAVVIERHPPRTRLSQRAKKLSAISGARPC